MKKRKLLFTCLLFSSIFSFSQVKENEIISKDKNGSPDLINFIETKVKADDKSVNAFLKKQFEESDIEFKQITFNDNKNNTASEKYQQYYKGIKVEFGVQNIVSEDGFLKVANGNFISIKNLSIIPTISEGEALKFALNEIGAKEYMWKNTESEKLLKKEENNEMISYFPKGELVIIEKNLFSKNPIPRLAYKFDIYAKYPISRNYVYVDAQNGEILFKDPIIKHILGIGNTRYSGQRNFETQQLSSNQFRLREYSRGNGIETLNMNNGTNYSAATDFIDNDNNWTSAEYNNSNYDNAAIDAHWGTQKTYDYFLQKHNRNSYNGNGGILRNYVHANLIGMGYSNNFNAFWDGQRMTYGDGYANPLTTLDITGHEIGHGVCSSSAGLVYSYESGAINESLSDIWGAMIEYFAEPTKQTYLIGEDVGAIRSMSNPKTYNHPDTYQGQYWYSGSGDNGGVHYNSGVFNHWFYILAEGKSGTNDLGNTYNISGIGKENAAKIVYRAETVYFTSTTNYSQARNLTIQAAKDLFGNNSLESATVCQAWYAVGVGSSCIVPITIDGNNNICSQSNYTYTISNLPPNSSVSWSYSTSSLNFISSTNTSIMVSPKSNYNGIASVTATINGQSYTKEIWVGKPLINVSLTPQGINYVSVEMIGANGTDINKQAITSTTWEKVSGGGGCSSSFSGSGFQALGHGTCNSWTVYAKITATNICGTTTIYKTITPPAPEECNDNYTLVNNNGIMSIIIDPCDNSIAPFVSNEIYHFIVYNTSGYEVLNQTNTSLNITTLQMGVYYVKVFKNNKLILNSKIVK
ncbi:M4 family metallopeptidase [Chryseobacterium sp. SC28]|uniref:M4 family metallopeptidase n=1 Tax=Chryseobacterium sp. SC28 TaxID=2268028 RepID=UPI000F65024C|nr:M4 family metallopeptidase [Chryseobacterium sp. SC28]RRQ45214.1 M4 family peptidase [Chryseobacterium sp. SC28]